MGLAERWRAARPAVEGLHLDSGACSRQSFAVIDAAAAHARREAEVGGYVAAQEAADILAAGRAAVATLTGMSADHVAFTTGASRGLDLLLSSWPDARRLIACVPGEFGPNLTIMEINGFKVLTLPVDDLGRVRTDGLEKALAADVPTLVHLTAVPSHRGIAQPIAEIAQVCRDQGIPLVIDAAQAFGQVDCALGQERSGSGNGPVSADAVYTTSRKWIAGPRGVGALAVRPELAERLRPRMPADFGVKVAAMRQLEMGEANVAAWVGFSTALCEYLTAGPEAMRTRLADVGRLTRRALADVPGWRVVEPEDSPTAITTLAPTAGADVDAVRADLIARHGIVTTAAGPARAPLELSTALLRLSPHVDATEDELTRFAEVLSSLCER